MRTQGVKLTTRQYFILVTIMITLSLTAACGNPSANQSDKAVQQAGPEKIEIISPPQGGTFRVGSQIEVQTNFANSAEISGAILLINDQPYREDTFYDSVHSGELLQPWTPQQAGTYTVQVLLETGQLEQRKSQQVIVYVIEATLPEAKEPSTVTPTSSSTPDTPTLTPTLEQPQATGTQNSNCRRGDDSAYDVMGILMEGSTVPISGINASGTWYVVNLDPVGDCWVWEGGIKVDGDISDLPVIIPPPLPATDTPEGPSYHKCSDYPDEPTCWADPQGFGGCSWDTGLGTCSK